MNENKTILDSEKTVSSFDHQKREKQQLFLSKRENTHSFFLLHL